MRKIWILPIGMVLLMSLPLLIISSQAVEYGDITCTEKFIPVHKFECRRPDMSIDKVFLTYESMLNWYVPPDQETYIAPVTYVYSAPTEAFSGR